MLQNDVNARGPAPPHTHRANSPAWTTLAQSGELLARLKANLPLEALGPGLCTLQLPTVPPPPPKHSGPEWGGQDQTTLGW